MKMIYAIVRPEKVYEVNKALADAGYGASTSGELADAVNSMNSGRRTGLCEMSKNMLMIVCDDDDKRNY